MEFTLDPHDFNPVHNASACIIKSGGKVLFLKKLAKYSREEVWEIPAGKIENGETPEAALIREVMEETGILVNEFSHLKTFNVRINKRNYDFIYHLFEANISEGSAVSISGEHLDYKWASIDDIKSFRFQPASEIYTDILLAQK